MSTLPDASTTPPTGSQSRRQWHNQTSYLSRKEALARPLLVVEDQRALALMQATLFKDRWGCEVHIADTLARTRELLAGGSPYFAASCDLHLPDAPGGEAIDLLVAAGIPTIAITAAFGGELRQRMLDKGVVDYVLKNSIDAYKYIADLIGFIRKSQSIELLVADDDPSMHRLVESIFKRYNMQVLHATHGEAALALARAHRGLRLALIDYVMPGFDGIKTTQALRQMFDKKDLAIIGLSSSQNKLLAAEFLKSGANDFIAKPFEFEELVCRVNQNLGMLYLIEENRKAAFTDYLTGLANRRAFFSEGPQRLGQMEPNTQHNVAVAMIDIDHFKKINDSYGHDAGDAALCHVAELIEDHFCDRLVARLGGEEFGILLEGCDTAAALAVTESFRADLAASPFNFGGQTIALTASIGIASGPAVGADLDRLLNLADRRLYAAKSAGRNRCVADEALA